MQPINTTQRREIDTGTQPDAQGVGEVVEPMTGDLLPCPFCGKANQDRWPCDWLDGSGANVIRCAWCHGAAPMNVWNRRIAPPSAHVGVPKVSVPADVMEARAQGRTEVLAIVLGLEAETGLDEYTQSIPPGPSGEWGTAWDEAKLRELFSADDTAWSLLQKAEGEYWNNLGLREEAERIHERRTAQQPAAVDGAMAWKPINELPASDDLFWFARGDTVDGPRPPQHGGFDADEWDWFAPAEAPPFTAAMDALARPQGGA